MSRPRVIGFHARPSDDKPLRLDALNVDDVQTVREWRLTCREGLRTPVMLGEEQQDTFYEKVVCKGTDKNRYFAVRDGDLLVAMVGLTGIEWENGMAEISLITDPAKAGKGIGSGALELLLREGFDVMGLATIYGECYLCNPAIGFWQRMCERYNAYTTTLPRRKRWAGKLWDSLYFSIQTPHGGVANDPDGSEGATER
jgi:RimJ/RimL family protein N-acetyltransferase